MNQWTPYHFDLDDQGEPVRCVMAGKEVLNLPAEWHKQLDYKTYTSPPEPELVTIPTDLFMPWDDGITNEFWHFLMHDKEGGFIERKSRRNDCWNVSLADLHRDIFATIDRCPNLRFVLPTRWPGRVREVWNDVDARPAGNLQKWRDNIRLQAYTESDREAMKLLNVCEVLEELAV